MPTTPPTALAQAAALLCLGCWLVAYVLIIRRGILDRTYGMPASALVLNLAWESLLEFVLELPYESWRIGYGLWFLFDLGILCTCLRYGRDDFSQGAVRRHFHLWLAAGFVLALAAEWAFITAYQDLGGTVLGWIFAIYINGAMCAMLVRRNSVRGQSAWIAVFILLGNLAGYFQLQVYPLPPPLPPRLLLHVFPLVATALGVAYLALVIDQSRREGLRPWSRW